MNKLTKIFLAPIAIPHELSHYVVARLLGLEARLQWTFVDVQIRQGDWRWLPVLVAPILLGFGFQAFFTYLAYKTSLYPSPINHLLALSSLAFNLIWQVMCLGDYRQIGRFFSE